jgi:hypothetical protein
MSWDIFVQNIPKDARGVGDIPDDFEPGPLGSRSEVVRRILEVAPSANASDPTWVTIDGPDFSIECNIGDDEEVSSFALHIRGGKAAAGLVSDLLSRNGWRALDPTAESGIFDPASAADSLRMWRAYRDRIAGRNDAG